MFHSSHGSDEFDGGVEDCLYYVNSDAMNGPNHVKDPDVLALGCSVTFGMGLPHDFSWVGVCRAALGVTVNSVAVPGSSVDHQVYRAFLHMRKYGVPKQIWFLLPDLFRGQMMIGPDKWFQRTVFFDHDKGAIVDHQYNPYVHVSLSGDETLVPVDMLLNTNLKALETLLMFCDISNVPVRLFSWHDPTFTALKNLKYAQLPDIPQHVKRYPGDETFPASTEQDEMLQFWSFPHEAGFMGQHECCDLQPSGYWQEKAWTVALDRTETWRRPHPGLHSQIHFAEIMSGQTIDPDAIKEIRPWHEGTDLEPARS